MQLYDTKITKLADYQNLKNLRGFEIRNEVEDAPENAKAKEEMKKNMKAAKDAYYAKQNEGEAKERIERKKAKAELKKMGFRWEAYVPLSDLIQK